MALTAQTLAATTLVCVGLQLYHYAGYPIIVRVLARMFGRGPTPDKVAEWPAVSLIIAAYNERGVIGLKIESSLGLDYPDLDIIVVADGSTDGTERIAGRWVSRTPRLRALFEPTRRGKSAAMNRGAETARGAILVFSDANAFYRADALRHLIAPFDEPNVAVVSGHKTIALGEAAGDAVALGTADGAYWSYEARIRDAESRLGATVATVGEMLAVRRSEWRPIPPGTASDDAYTTMTALSRGRDVRFAPKAVSVEPPSRSSVAERRRRRRINAGRLQLLTLPGVWPWRRPAVLVAFLSHKVLRLALPLLLVTGFAANAATVALRPAWDPFAAMLVAHVLLFGLATAGFVAERHRWRWKPADLAYHVVGSSFTVFGALADFMSGRRVALWEKADR